MARAKGGRKKTSKMKSVAKDHRDGESAPPEGSQTRKNETVRNWEGGIWEKFARTKCQRFRGKIAGVVPKNALAKRQYAASEKRGSQKEPPGEGSKKGVESAQEQLENAHLPRLIRQKT